MSGKEIALKPAFDPSTFVEYLPELQDQMDEAQKKAAEAAKASFERYRKTWPYLSKGVSGSRYAIEVGVGYAGPTARFAREFSTASLGLRTLGTFGGPLSVVGAVDESRRMVKSYAIGDREGATLAAAGVGLNVGDMVDTALTAGVVAATVTGNPTYNAFAGAMLPVGIGLTGAATGLQGWHSYKGYQFLAALKELPDVRNDDEIDLDFRALQRELIVWLDAHVGVTQKERIGIQREVKARYPDRGRAFRTGRRLRREQRLMQTKQNRVVRAASQDVYDRLKELYDILLAEHGAPVEEILQGLEKIRLARCLVQRRNRARYADIGSNGFIMAGLGAFYITTIAPYVPFGLLLAGVGMKGTTKMYEKFFLKRGLELLEEAIRPDAEVPLEEDEATDMVVVKG